MSPEFPDAGKTEWFMWSKITCTFSELSRCLLNEHHEHHERSVRAALIGLYT